jgi:dUTP pyrophosphatase
MPGETVLVCTGWAVSIPIGTEIQVRLTSGNGLKTKMRIPNAPGTVDSNYRGEIGVILENTSDNVFILEKNSKVAQLVLCPVLKALVRETNELDETDRNDKGYGSTGSMINKPVKKVSGNDF